MSFFNLLLIGCLAVLIEECFAKIKRLEKKLREVRNDMENN